VNCSVLNNDFSVLNSHKSPACSTFIYNEHLQSSVGRRSRYRRDAGDFEGLQPSFHPGYRILACSTMWSQDSLLPSWSLTSIVVSSWGWL
jgi:hypothetical protein